MRGKQAITIWMWLSGLAGIAIGGSSLLAQESKLPTELVTPPITIRFVAGSPHQKISDHFVVADIPADSWREISSLAKRGESLSHRLQVRVAGQETLVLGKVVARDRQLVFEPRFALMPGLEYVVRVELEWVGDASGKSIATKRFIVPNTDDAPRGEISAVYPSADRLPQNVLKMYLEFSRPMSRGEAYQRIRFLDESGQEIAEPFIRLDQELWSADGKRFTLLFDPGRIKRELRPHQEIGTPFGLHRQYTLVVDASWRDSRGNPLKREYRKTFFTTEPDRIQPDPQMWKVSVPASQSSDAIEIEFQEPLDRAMLDHAIRIFDPRGRRVAGQTIISNNEQRWSLRPESMWQTGRYKIQVDARLEDRAGNCPAYPFEVQLDAEASTSVKGTELAFYIHEG